MGFMLNFADIEIATGENSWVLTIPEQPTRRLVEAACQVGAGERLRLVREALAELTVETARPLAPMSEPTRRMWMYLRRERLSPISTRDVLRASGLGPTRAQALFKAWFGVTPLRLLQQHRLEYARHLMAQGTPVAKAAAASGFRNRRHLTATCRTVYGIPPSRLR
jgi:AraC-like DNA-binding protein